MVTAEIPECSENFRYKWRESGTNKDSKSFRIFFSYLKKNQFIVIYSTIIATDLIRKLISQLKLQIILNVKLKHLASFTFINLQDYSFNYIQFKVIETFLFYF